LLTALTLRVWQLDTIPPGLSHDEASNGYDAAGVLQGIRPIYFTVGYGHEPLYPYSVSLVMALLGPSKIALRLTTVGWGLVLILLSYALARKLFNPATAMLTAAWMAVSFWCVMTSRIGLRAITATVTFTASALCFWMALSSQQNQTRSSNAINAWIWWTLSGVSLGASIYTYMASRAMPAVYILFALYLLALKLLGIHQRLFRTGATGIIIILLIGTLVAAPLIHFLITNPEAEGRIGQLDAPLVEARRGNFGLLWKNITETLPMFTFRGDPLWLYNIPGRPLLDVALGPFFYAGLLLCLWHWREPRCAFLLLWLTISVSPALITGHDATTLRAIVAQPAIFIIATLALTTVLKFFQQRLEQWKQWGKAMAIGSVGTLIALTGVRTVNDYFHVWANQHDVRTLYHHALVQEAAYLDAQPEGGTVALSSIFPGRFHDPYTMEVALQREDLSLRWFDGRFALIFPTPDSASEDGPRVIIPTLATLDETLKPLFNPYASHIHTERFRPDDLVQRFDVYRFDAAEAFDALLPSVIEKPVYWSASNTFSLEEPTASYKPLSLPVNVNHVVELVGYDLRTPSVPPGGEVELLTVWRVRQPFPPEAILFTHLLDHNSQVIGQADRLDVPSWHWQPGDAFVQIHRFPIQAETTPRRYHLQVGFYTRKGHARLPIIADGDEVDDRILLSPLDVTADG
jgi:TM2 domain-containing membrane protein YozV